MCTTRVYQSGGWNPHNIRILRDLLNFLEAWRRGGFEPPHGGINFTNKAEIDTLKAAISENCTEIERARRLPLDDTSSIRAHLGNTRLRKCRIASRCSAGPPG